jgi:hypothetical protein
MTGTPIRTRFLRPSASVVGPAQPLLMSHPDFFSVLYFYSLLDSYFRETAWTRVIALHACVIRLMAVVLEQIRTVYTRSWNSMKLAAEQSLLHIWQDGALQAYITVQITPPPQHPAMLGGTPIRARSVRLLWYRACTAQASNTSYKPLNSLVSLAHCSL